MNRKKQAREVITSGWGHIRSDKATGSSDTSPTYIEVAVQWNFSKGTRAPKMAVYTVFIKQLL